MKLVVVLSLKVGDVVDELTGEPKPGTESCDCGCTTGEDRTAGRRSAETDIFAGTCVDQSGLSVGCGGSGARREASEVTTVIDCSDTTGGFWTSSSVSDAAER